MCIVTFLENKCSSNDMGSTAYSFAMLLCILFRTFYFQNNLEF